MGKQILNGVVYGNQVPYRELTKAEYDALPNSKYNDGIMYYIRDVSSPEGLILENVYWTAGQIVDSATTGATAAAIGTATVHISNHMARIDFFFKVTNANGSSSDFDWGISATALHQLNSNIPVITPIQGGYYYTNQGNMIEAVGYGNIWSPTANNTHWLPARIYTTSGDLGAWPTNMLRTDGLWFGCCYGTI